MRKRAMWIGASLILGAIFLVGTTDFILNRAFYNPYRQPESSAAAFQEAVVALVPSACYSHLSSYQPGTPRHFSLFSQNFYILSRSSPMAVQESYVAKGSLQYLFGNGEAAFTVMPPEKWIFTQADYLTGKEIPLSSLEADAYYVAQIGSAETITQEQVSSAVQALKSYDSRADMLRAILCTSDNPDDVALGIDGTGEMAVINLAEYSLEYAAGNFLHVLSQKQETIDIFLHSGMFGKLDVHFNERHQYVKENGVHCIGLSVFAQGAALQVWLQTNNFRLIHIQPADGRSR